MVLTCCGLLASRSGKARRCLLQPAVAMPTSSGCCSRLEPKWIRIRFVLDCLGLPQGAYCVRQLVVCDLYLVMNAVWCRYELQERGETLLYAAASRGHAEVVRLLIEAGVDMNQAAVCTF